MEEKPPINTIPRLPVASQRLFLRDLTHEDTEAVYSYMSDPEVAKYIYTGPFDREETRELIQLKVDSQTDSARKIYDLA